MSLFVKPISSFLPSPKMSLDSTCILLSSIVHEPIHEKFCLGFTLWLNKPKIKTWTWLFYKQTNMNKLFIKSNPTIYEWHNSFTTLIVSLFIDTHFRDTFSTSPIHVL